MERESVAAQCPYCGETVEVEVDLHGPTREQCTEDCPVCCRPWDVTVSRTDEGLDVGLSRDDD